MARGSIPQPDGGAGPDEPGATPDGGAVRQRDILAQFQDAIAGMRTRDIQIGLRELLARSVPPTRTPGPPPPATAPAPGTNPETGRPHPAVSSRKGPFSAAMAGAVTARHDDDGGGPGDAPDPGTEPGTSTVPAPVARLARAVRTPSARRQIQRLVTDAELDQAVQLDTAAPA